MLSARNDMRLFNHKISVPSQSDVVVMMLMYPGCMAIGIIQDQKQEHNLDWPYVALRTAIPTSVFNFVQLLFMLVSVLIFFL